MSYAIDRAARGAAAIGAAGALVLLPLGTGNAQGPENSPAFQLAQAQTSPTRPSPARPGAGQQQPASRDQQVEAQLKQLQQELAITDAQKAQFDAFGQVMRSNAQAISPIATSTGPSGVASIASYTRW